jgi:hypothetical protein
MQPAKDLDELWDQQAKAHAMLMDDPKRLLQARELANTAGKLIDIVKTKLVACELAGAEADIPQLGKFKGKPRTGGRRLLGDG